MLLGGAGIKYRKDFSNEGTGKKKKSLVPENCSSRVKVARNRNGRWSISVGFSDHGTKSWLISLWLVLNHKGHVVAYIGISNIFSLII